MGPSVELVSAWPPGSYPKTWGSHRDQHGSCSWSFAEDHVGETRLYLRNSHRDRALRGRHPRNCVFDA